MTEAITMQLSSFVMVYLLLLVVIAIFRWCRIGQTALLLTTSLKMTIQLIIAGYILMYIFQNPNPLFTVTYLTIMIGFTIYRTLNRNKGLNHQFKIITGLSIAVSGLLIICFLMYFVIEKSIFNPQYVIPISGMLMGNTLTSSTLALKSFREATTAAQDRITVLLNMGASPSKILFPFVGQAMSTALLPTLNNMAGMGIVALPGMMTGQILAGVFPMTAILYQITLMIAITATTCLASFGILYFGHRTLWNKRNQISLSE